MADFSEDLPVDPAVDPQVPELPSEVSSGFYDNTPVDQLQAEDLQEVPPPDEPPAASDIETGPTPVDYGATTQVFDDGTTIQTFDDGSTLTTNVEGNIIAQTAPVSPDTDPSLAGPPASLANINNQQNASSDPVSRLGLDAGTFSGPLFDTNTDQSTIKGLVQNAQRQQTISNQRRQINNTDWRVRLRLAPQANYLYNARQPGILLPLQTTDGVIFPYTPSISTSYRANYSSYDLTHSNYRGYFYQNSYVDAINLNCTFTAQDTNEANYLLAVIHFFRSVTKMFYGQDAERGTPPPLVYLSGLGQYQFNEHACLVQQFNYTLPPEVDYIRAQSVTQTGQDLSTRRVRPNGYSGTISPSVNRLITSFLTLGALPNPPAGGANNVLGGVNGNSPTYVPTKMDIQVTLLPIQSRNQVSQQFSVKEFANGNLLRGGFW